jgi:hypothetical protein
MSNLDVRFDCIMEGVYGDEELCLICRMYAGYSDGWAVMIDVNLEDLGAPQIWRPMSSTDDGHPLLPSPATEVEHVEQEVRRQVKLLLLRLENLIQQARVKGATNE